MSVHVDVAAAIPSASLLLDLTGGEIVALAARDRAFLVLRAGTLRRPQMQGAPRGKPRATQLTTIPRLRNW